MGCVYFYFNENDANQPDVPRLWAALLQQLLHQCASVGIAQEIQSGFESSLCGASPIHPLENFNFFKAQASKLRIVYVVIDGLHNCVDHHHDTTQQSLCETFQNLPPNVRVLFSSRHGSPANYLGVEQKLQVKPKASDIEAYVRNRIKNSSALDSVLTEENVTLVIDKIRSHTLASEMFLLARLHMDSLGAHSFLWKVKEALDQLPIDLSDVFKKSLQKFADQPNVLENSLARHVFTWVIYGKKDLTLGEVQEGFALLQGQGRDYQECRPHENSILSACAGLVVLDSDRRTLRLVHESVQEHVLEHDIVSQEAHLDILKICLKCLIIEEPSDGRGSPLLSYSANHWTSHLHDPDLVHDEESTTLIKKFLGNRFHLTRAFRNLIMPRDGCPQKFEGMTGLHATVYLDLPDWVAPLVESGINVNAQCSDGQTALHWAAAYGRHLIVQRLLGSSADLNIQDSSGDTALHKCLISPTADGPCIARDLVRAGADLCIRGARGLTPLFSAIRNGPTSLAELFILSQKDINVEVEKGWTSMREVFFHGREVVDKLGNYRNHQSSLSPMSHAVEDHLHCLIDLLLKKGANLNQPTSDGWLPLIHAVQEGNVMILRKLLEHKPNPANSNLRDPAEGWSPLRWALFYKHQHVVRLLVEHGSNTNERNDDGWKPLAEAVKANDSDMTHYLIKNGSRLDEMDVRGYTPLLHSIKQRKSDIAWLLTVNGADVNLRSKNAPRAIDTAMENGDYSIAWLLCEHGVDLEATDDKGMTPLHRAARAKDLRRVSFFLDRGSTIGTRDQYGFTPLHYAVLYGSEDLVHALASRNSEQDLLDTPDRDGKSALILATMKKKVGMIRTILRCGGSCEFKDGKGITALHYAAGQGLDEGLRAMMRQAQDINVGDEMGFTAVHHAVNETRENTLEVLIQVQANLDILDNSGRTPLMLAVQLDSPVLARQLLLGKADMHKKNKQGWSAMDMAERMGYLEMRRVLRMHQHGQLT
ncbi:hypothetical protein ACHAPJ_005250 [Fusarium lateritium]